MEDVGGGGGGWVENQYNTVCVVGGFLFVFIRLSTINLFKVVSKFWSRQLSCQSERPVQGYLLI